MSLEVKVCIWISAGLFTRRSNLDYILIHYHYSYECKLKIQGYEYVVEKLYEAASDCFKKYGLC
jgi:hypothetical protein